MATVYVGIGKTIEIIQDKRGEMLKSYIEADDILGTVVACSTRAAPRGSLHAGRSTVEGVADIFYTDVRSILMILWMHFKGTKIR